MAFFPESYPEDIFNRVAHDFPANECSQVTAILKGVRDLGWHVPWVQLAVLRAASGHVHHLQQWVDLGNTDPRNLKQSIELIAGPGWEQEFILYAICNRSLP